MSKAIAEIAAGAALIALDVVTLGATTPLLLAGISLIVAGISTLLSSQHQGIAANLLNPVAPWNVIYGHGRVGGTTIWQQTNGDTDKFWHRVIVLACHPCHSVDALIFDDKRVCLDTSGNSLSFGGSTSVTASQQTVNIAGISRTNDVVTVVMAGPMPLPAPTAAGPALQTGDTVQIQDVGADQTLNGQYQILVTNATTFTYICGGNPISTSGGSVKTQWPDYGDTIHFEVALGAQGPGNPPFPGLLATDGTGSGGTWTDKHLCQGRTAVYLRMKYGGNTYQPGIPTLGFLVSGKNDIYDPRFSTHAFTENSALCIADFLAQKTWGFKLNYGTDIPNAPLVAAANICDESVTLASGGFETRYTCNGSFQLTAKRGEILSNLLTSCGGRITYSGGQYVVNPAAWTGATVQIGNAIPTNLAGSPITSATLNVWASYTQGPSGIGSPAIAGVFGPFTPNAGLIGSGPRVGTLIQDFDFTMGEPGSPPTRLTQAISVNQLGFLGQLQIVAGIVGTLSGLETGAGSVLKIYDVNLFVTYQDGTTGTIRPVASANQQGVAGTVTNQQNAADVDTNPPVTFASVARTQYGGLIFIGYLQLSNFAFPTTNNVAAGALTLQYAAGPFQWKPKLAIRDLYNGVKGTYVSPVNNWQSSDMPPYAQDTDHGYSAPPGTTGYYDINLAADGGDRRWFDMQFPFTNSPATAQRIAKIELLRRRSQGTGTFAFNLAMYQLTALDVVAMTVPYLGWTGKLLEVTSHRFTVQKHDDTGQIALGTELDLQETDSSIYEWSDTEELNAAGFQQPGLVGTQIISAPTGLTLASGPALAVSGIGRVQITWTLPEDGFITSGGYTLVQYSLDDQNWVGLGQFDSSTTTTYIPSVIDGQQYWVRIAFVNVAGVQSPWTVEGPITASGSNQSFHRIDDETPDGVVDGTNPIFTLSQIPNPAASLQLYLNGVLLNQGLDYTLDGKIITFKTLIPIPQDWLRAWYWY